MGNKRGSTYYTPERVRAARSNVWKTQWGRRLLEETKAKADVYVRLGWEALWSLPTPQAVPRSYAVNQRLGCPVCGEAHHAYGRWPWIADPIRRPWKLECPNCAAVFPTNDFAAYYESGRDERGLFRKELADERHLRNVLAPERGERWGTDDGTGWTDDNGDRWTFVAFYNHWKVWKAMVDPQGNRFPPTDAPWGHGGMIENGLAQLRDAYLLTGDKRYALAGVVLLARVADVYPELDVGAFQWEDGFLNSHGMSGQGKAVGSIWETGLVKTFVTAYDAFCPAIRDGGSELAAFLRRKKGWDRPGDPATIVDRICDHIENGILRQVYEGVKKAQIRGNNGMHQSALALAAVVLDEEGTTQQWLDFVFRDGETLPPSRGGWAVTGGDVGRSLVRDVDRDGFGNEASPMYNYLWVETFKQLADILHGYDRYPQGDLYNHPRFRQMLRAPAALIMAEEYVPNIGDCDSAGKPGRIARPETAASAFARTNDPLLARLAYQLNGNRTEGLTTDIFDPDPQRLCARIEQAVREHGTLPSRSAHLGGYGFAALRDGEGERMRGLWMYYGRNFGHGHKDTLNIGLYAYGLDLAPDMGYPEKCDNSHQKTHHWDRNTVCHNTVMVDRSKQGDSVVGRTLLFADGSEAQAVEAEAPHVYPQTTTYRRAVVLVRIDEERSYAVDVFRVKGGGEHHYLFHGPEGETRAEGLRLVRQDKGTYAGPDVAFGEPFDADPSVPLPQYRGSGFHYLTGVERDASPPQQFAVEWLVRDTWGASSQADGVRLRLEMIGAADEAALADGEPSQNRPGNPRRLRQLLARRRAGGGGSRFVAVIEPYRHERAIRSIVPVAVTTGGRRPSDADAVACEALSAVALRIEHTGGRVDYIVHSTDPLADCVVDGRIAFRGAVGVYAEQDGEPVFAFVAGGSRIGPAEKPAIDGALPSLAGTVTGFTTELALRNEIRVRFDEASPDFLSRLAGLYVHVNGSGRNPVFRIESCEQRSGGEVALDIGSVSLIEDWADSPEPSAARPGGEAAAAAAAAEAADEDEAAEAASGRQPYKYAIAVGDRFTIPLHASWRRISRN